MHLFWLLWLNGGDTYFTENVLILWLNNTIHYNMIMLFRGFGMWSNEVCVEAMGVIFWHFCNGCYSNVGFNTFHFVWIYFFSITSGCKLAVWKQLKSVLCLWTSESAGSAETVQAIEGLCCLFGIAVWPYICMCIYCTCLTNKLQSKGIVNPK